MLMDDIGYRTRLFRIETDVVFANTAHTDIHRSASRARAVVEDFARQGILPATTNIVSRQIIKTTAPSILVVWRSANTSIALIFGHPTRPSETVLYTSFEFSSLAPRNLPGIRFSFNPADGYPAPLLDEMKRMKEMQTQEFSNADA